MRVATLDIGTNCVLLLVADSDGHGLSPVLERATITRLGEGVDRTRRLASAARDRTLACLTDYARAISALGVERVAAVGTSALRDAEGGADFIARASEVLGVRPRVISGEEEARLTFAGALTGLAVRGKVMVFDIGGGSTEVVIGESRDGTRSIDSAVSLDVGSVRLFERHVRGDPPAASELALVERDIESALRSVPPCEPGTTLVGVAGTVTQLAAIELELLSYDSSRVHGHRMSRATIEELFARLSTSTIAERRAWPGMEPARADVIVVGSAIAAGVLRSTGAVELLVSDRGVRWGLAEVVAANDSASSSRLGAN